MLYVLYVYWRVFFVCFCVGVCPVLCCQAEQLTATRCLVGNSMERSLPAKNCHFFLLLDAQSIRAKASAWQANSSMERSLLANNCYCKFFCLKHWVLATCRLAFIIYLGKNCGTLSIYITMHVYWLCMWWCSEYTYCSQHSNNSLLNSFHPSLFSESAAGCKHHAWQKEQTQTFSSASC